MLYDNEIKALSAVYKEMDAVGRKKMLKMARKFMSVQRILKNGQVPEGWAANPLAESQLMHQRGSL